MSYSIDWNEASPDEERASAQNLDLAPWVAEEARKVKELHMRRRRAEPLEVTISKIAKWRRRDQGPDPVEVPWDA